MRAACSHHSLNYRFFSKPEPTMRFTENMSDGFLIYLIMTEKFRKVWEGEIIAGRPPHWTLHELREVRVRDANVDRYISFASHVRLLFTRGSFLALSKDSHCFPQNRNRTVIGAGIYSITLKCLLLRAVSLQVVDDRASPQPPIPRSS